MNLPAAFVAALALASLPSCGGFGSGKIMPGRDESFSYFSGNVERKFLPTVHFAEDSALVSDGEAAKIRQLQAFLAKNPGTQLLLAGFAPDVGTEEYNRILGEQRAQNVRSALIDRGADATRIQTVSYGSLYAGANNDDSRRVEAGVVRPPPP